MSGKTVNELGEFGLIQRIQSILGPSSPNILVGLGDDAAVVPPGLSPLVVTTDAMIDGIHFRSVWTSAADLAHKALASNLSDLAAKCADPLYGVVTIGLPSGTEVSWVESFYTALAERGNEWGIEIVGGDTVRAPQLIVSITVIGTLMTENPVTVRSARVGDDILVTGTLGDAAAGLEILDRLNLPNRSPESHPYLIERFLRPRPRVREALSIIQSVLPSSMTDISDGLARDLPKLCQASRVGAEIDPNRIPYSDSLRNYASDPVEYAWRGGEDYELLFTLSPSDTALLLNSWDRVICPITVIGSITPIDRGIRVSGWDGTLDKGFDHFA